MNCIGVSQVEQKSHESNTSISILVDDSSTSLLLDENDESPLLRQLAGASQIPPLGIAWLRRVRRFAAKQLFKQLVPANALGFDPEKGNPKRGSLLFYAIEQKNQYPDNVILLRVGTFLVVSFVE